MNPKKQKPNAVIYYAPVNPIFFAKWEYYQSDYEVLRRLYNNVYVCHSLRDYLKYVSVNADVFCWWWHSSLPVIIFSKLLRRRLLCTGAIHMFDYSGAPDFYTKSFLYRLFSKIALSLATYNLFISRDQEESITSHLKVRNPRLVYSSLLPDACNLRWNEIHTLRLARSSGPTKFLYFSWLTKEQLSRKGFWPTLDAFSKYVAEVDPDAILCIAGKCGDAFDSIGEMVIALGLSKNTEFHLDLSNEQKRSLLRESDLLFTPSFMEGFGNASLEAMAIGLPAVVSRYGASHEVVGDTGYIVNSIDSDSILSVMKNYDRLDIEERILMSRRAFERAHTFFGFEKRLSAIESILG